MTKKTIIKIMGEERYRRIATDIWHIIIILFAMFCLFGGFAVFTFMMCENGSFYECLFPGRF